MYVDQGHVGDVFLDVFDCFTRIGRLGHHSNVSLAENATDSVADGGVVVGDHAGEAGSGAGVFVRHWGNRGDRQFQFCSSEWLLKKESGACFVACVGGLVAWIARHVDNRCFRMDEGRAAGEFAAADSRHHHVGEE